MAVLNCANEEVVAHVPQATEADAAAQAARQAFDHGPWPYMTPTERTAYFEKIAVRLEALNDESARGWT